MNYPPSIRIIRVPCTGKVDVIHILHAFEKGADGVYLVGCMEGECHYKYGNIRAKKRVEQAKKILDTVGVGAERARMYNLSSSDAPLFVKYAKEMHELILEIGPNPVKGKKKKTAA